MKLLVILLFSASFMCATEQDPLPKRTSLRPQDPHLLQLHRSKLPPVCGLYGSVSYLHGRGLFFPASLGGHDLCEEQQGSPGVHTEWVLGVQVAVCHWAGGRVFLHSRRRQLLFFTRSVSIHACSELKCVDT